MRGHRPASLVWAAIAVIAAIVVLACGGGSLKAAGEGCLASSECESGLVCDFGQSPAVCSQQGTIRPDGSVEDIDAPPDPGIDAGIDARPDARPPDAAVDAAVDAAIDAI